MDYLKELAKEIKEVESAKDCMFALISDPCAGCDAEKLDAAMPVLFNLAQKRLEELLSEERYESERPIREANDAKRAAERAMIISIASAIVSAVLVAIALL